MAIGRHDCRIVSEFGECGKLSVMHRKESHDALPMAASPASNRPTVVLLAADLSVSTRMENVIHEQGGHPITTESPAAFVAAVDRCFPVLALVDLVTAGDWQTAIQHCKLLPHTRQLPIYAFGSLVDTAVLAAALSAGVDHVWERSRMIDDFPALVAEHVCPPLRYPDGWDDILSEKARLGIDEFNRGDYFEQHELLEAAWLEETRPIREMYQGILQVGVAFLQIQRGNWAGAIKMFRRGLPRLRALPDICQGVQIAAFRAATTAIHDEITALGPQQLGNFDQRRFPKIEVSGSAEQLQTVNLRS